MPHFTRGAGREGLLFNTKDQAAKLRESSIANFEENGWSGFDEDRKGINQGLKLSYIVELALESGQSEEDIAADTELKVDFVKRILVHHGLRSYDDIEPEAGAPWAGRPHPDTIEGQGGDYESEPWG